MCGDKRGERLGVFKAGEAPMPIAIFVYLYYHEGEGWLARFHLLAFFDKFTY